MTKIDKILYLFFFLAIIVGMSVVYPYSIAQLEATDYFVFSDDYLAMKIAELPGVTALLSDFLMQFYRWQGVGMLIEATVLTLMALMLSDIPKRIGHQTYHALGLFLPMALLFISLSQLEFHLQSLFMVLAIWSFFRLSKPLYQYIYLLLFELTALLVMPWTMMILASVTMAVGWVLHSRNLRSVFAALAFIILTLIWSYYAVGLMSDTIGFVQLNKRYLYAPVEDLSVWIYLAFFVGALLLTCIPFKINKWATYGIQCAILAIGCTVFVLIFTNKQLRLEEKSQRLAALAEKKDWKQIMKELPGKEAVSNKVYMCYAMLAEAALGTLPENLFKYPVVFSENLLYRDNSKDFCRNFNRQFYENIEIYDECFRQSYEYGIQSRNGLCFAAMRQMIKYAVLTDNYPVAEKYIEKIACSPTHVSLAKKWRHALEAQKKRNAQSQKPLRANTFVGAYLIGLEMMGQLEFGHQSQMIIDYALISFLLDCDLDNFMKLLIQYHAYEGRQLPKAYAEAVAMIISDTGDETIRQYVSYPPQYDMQFRQFDAQYMAEKEGKDIPGGKTDFSGTYWNYFVKASQLTPTDTGN